MSGTGYLHPNDDAIALERLRGLEAIEDPGTIGVLESLGDLAGTRSLEVGPGAGSIARWLRDRIGPTGELLLTDTDPRFVAALASAQVSVRTHDITTNPLPRHAFDLIHIRHVLLNVGSGDGAALDTLCDSLRPGGTLIVEESDFAGAGSVPDSPVELASAYDAGLTALLAVYGSRGMNVHYGAEVPSALRRRGLQILRTASQQRAVQGGSPEARFQHQSVGQVQQSAGDVDRVTFEAMRAALLDSRLRYRSRQTVCVIARQPL